jgi:predicted transcriptional regulator
MVILLSIKPEFAEKIFSGDKRYEFRKRIFRRDVVTVIVYASAPISQVVGEFDIEHLLHAELGQLWLQTEEFAGISKDYFDAYFGTNSCGYAIKVKNPREYSVPFDLCEMYPSQPPQSFIYLTCDVRKPRIPPNTIQRT